MQSIYIPAELYMQLCYFLGKVYENFLGFVAVLLLVLGLMVWYYRMLWKNAVVDSDKLFEISENLASQQHRRALEGLQEFRAFTRRRRRRLAFGGRLDIDEPHGEPGVVTFLSFPFLALAISTKLLCINLHRCRTRSTGG